MCFISKGIVQNMKNAKEHHLHLPFYEVISSASPKVARTAQVLRLSNMLLNCRYFKKGVFIKASWKTTSYTPKPRAWSCRAIHVDFALTSAELLWVECRHQRTFRILFLNVAAIQAKTGLKSLTYYLSSLSHKTPSVAAHAEGTFFFLSTFHRHR